MLSDGEQSLSLQKWRELGPIDILEFYKNITGFYNFCNFVEKPDEDGTPVKYNLTIGDYNYNHSGHFYTGQLDPHTLKPHGLGRKISLKNGRVIEG
jgi:hypothetical protein